MGLPFIVGALAAAYLLSGCIGKNDDAVPDDSDNGDNQTPKSYDLSPQTSVPDIRGELESLVAGEHEGQLGCWAVTRVPADAQNSTESHRQFVTPSGLVGDPIRMPIAHERTFGSGTSYTDPATGEVISAITFTSTGENGQFRGWPTGASGNQHGVFVFSGDETLYDFNAYINDNGLTRPGDVVVDDSSGEPTFRTVFGNGSIYLDNNLDVGSFDHPSIVSIPAEGPYVGRVHNLTQFTRAYETNFKGLAIDGFGQLVLGAAGGTVSDDSGPLVGPQGVAGAILRLNPNYEVDDSFYPFQIPAGIGIGATATDFSGRIYLSGWREDGDSLIALNGDETTPYNLLEIADVPAYHFVQGLLAFDNQVYVRVTDRTIVEIDGVDTEVTTSRTFSFDPRDGSPAAEEYEEIPAQFTHNFYGYDVLSDGTRLYCAGESGTGIQDEGGRSVVTSTVSFHDAIPQ